MARTAAAKTTRSLRIGHPSVLGRAEREVGTEKNRSQESVGSSPEWGSGSVLSYGAMRRCAAVLFLFACSCQSAAQTAASQGAAITDAFAASTVTTIESLIRDKY